MLWRGTVNVGRCLVVEMCGCEGGGATITLFITYHLAGKRLFPEFLYECYLITNNKICLHLFLIIPLISLCRSYI